MQRNKSWSFFAEEHKDQTTEIVLIEDSEEEPLDDDVQVIEDKHSGATGDENGTVSPWTNGI